MTPTWQTAVRPTIDTVLQAEAVTGMVLAVAQGDGAAEQLWLGADATGMALSPTTLFPVASLTKLATALAVLRLIAAGAMTLDESLTRLLPDAAAAQPGVTPRTLLCHTSGLPVDFAPNTVPYALGLNWPTLARACLAVPLSTPPRTEVCYSNLGYGLLALMVERLTGQPFPTALTDLVLTPLGLEGYLSANLPRPAAQLGGRLGEHAGTALEPFNSLFWRDLALPWAGLLTTATGALALVRAFAGVPTGFLPLPLTAEATSDQTGGLAGGTPGFLRWTPCPWGLGVELRGAKRPYYTPANASPATFGHAGGSGACAFADPQVGIAWAMLSTRPLPGWWVRWPHIGAAILSALDSGGLVA